MQKLKLILVGLVVVFVLSETPAFAQGIPNMGGGMGGPPRRKLKKNSSPALSPALNLVPGAVTSFEGQFLLRTIPQERTNNFISQTNNQMQGLQNGLKQAETEIRTGTGKTGHSSSFMNYKGYYQMRNGGRQR
jgi:hypothetical protein